MSITTLPAGPRLSPVERITESDIGALIVVIRTPKSASTTLATIVLQAFPDSRAFVLPNTLDIEGSISGLQHLRYIRHAARINYRAHRLLRLSQVFDRINFEAAPGDMLTGGHIDFDTCRRNLTRPFKFVTLVRNPVERSLSEYAYARAGFMRKRGLAKFDASLIAKTAGRYSFEGYLDFLTDHRAAFGDIACRYVGLRPGDDIAAHFATHAYHFGTVDNLPAFAQGLTKKAGQFVHEQHLNQTMAPQRLKLSSRERNKIESLYAGDFELYDWCRRHEAQAPIQQHARPALSLVAATA